MTMARVKDMFGKMKSHIRKELQEIRQSGLYKAERVIGSAQDAKITVRGGQKVSNLCANNYLGLTDHPEIIKATMDSYDKWGYGLASVWFICRTQEIHKELDEKISGFLGTEETIPYSCCFDANTGLFETLPTGEDAIISDQLNHASIIDGIRLCKAQRPRFENSNMEALEEKFKDARSARSRKGWGYSV
jgi:glycine C-acetyltransferase